MCDKYKKEEKKKEVATFGEFIIEGTDFEIKGFENLTKITRQDKPDEIFALVWPLENHDAVVITISSDCVDIDERKNRFEAIRTLMMVYGFNVMGKAFNAPKNIYPVDILKAEEMAIKGSCLA